MAVDSYGGATNNPARARDTAIWQRSSVMKLQYQTYWQDAEGRWGAAEGDPGYLYGSLLCGDGGRGAPGDPFPNDHV